MVPLAGTGECAPTVVRTAQILELVAIGCRADPQAPILIRGEPGVGKDTLARLIHDASTRRSHAFVKVSCAARSADQSEADLFGHERGASPLALRRRAGSFEFANHGTLYLDEIGVVPPATIPKLLHTLRTGEVSRAGGREIIRVDVRLIASTVHGVTHRRSEDLWQKLHGLNAIEICIPPLRQRTEEIPAFASFFLERLNHRYRRDVRLCSDVIAAFQAHQWPGNIRELEEAVDRLVFGGATTPVQ